MIDLEKLVRVGILFDFYGQLLSDRQFTAVELYYIYDLSLSEIGENLDISRQAVYDTLKRAETNLEEFESKLKLVSKATKNRGYIDLIYKNVEEILDMSEDDGIKLKSIEIKNIIAEMLNSNQEVVT